MLYKKLLLFFSVIVCLPRRLYIYIYHPFEIVRIRKYIGLAAPVCCLGTQSGETKCRLQRHTNEGRFSEPHYISSNGFVITVSPLVLYIYFYNMTYQTYYTPQDCEGYLDPPSHLFHNCILTSLPLGSAALYILFQDGPMNTLPFLFPPRPPLFSD